MLSFTKPSLEAKLLAFLCTLSVNLHDFANTSCDIVAGYWRS